jgi:ABC-type sugar transport system ATPase subunit
MEEYALRMTGISKRFGPVQALSDVTFQVRRGTVHALCGENGAGKSTLMKILSGVYHPDSGSIEIDGSTKTFKKPGEALECGITMIYQELDLAEDLTVAENVFLGAEPMLTPLTMDLGKMLSETANLAKKYNFVVKPDAVVSNLSTGDCQIVELLKALRKNASIIVMDEPTSSLSEKEALRLFGVVKDLRSRGMTIIYISHRLEEVTELSDDISVLRDGKVVNSAKIAEMEISSIVHHMVGRELGDFFPQRKVSTGDVRIKVDSLSSEAGVKNVTFEVRSGEIVGMAGLVGAGRTEVARAIFGIDRMTSGELTLDSRKIQIRSPEDAIANRMAFLTEDRKRSGLCLQLPCSWNITLPNFNLIGMRRFINPGREDALSSEYGSKMKLKWAGPKAPANSLSGGNQQKLLIARWLMANSEFLIFDEPTRGIDVGAKREIYLLLNTLAEEGKSLLFISSEFPELFGVTDRILVMRRGELVGNLETKKTNPEEVMHLAAVE